MEDYPSGILVKERLLGYLDDPYKKVLFLLFLDEVERLQDRGGRFVNYPLIRGTADTLLGLPAGLTMSNFLTASFRKSFRRAVGCASQIRGLISGNGVVKDLEKFFPIVEDLSGHLVEILDAIGVIPLIEVEIVVHS